MGDVEITYIWNSLYDDIMNNTLSSDDLSNSPDCDSCHLKARQCHEKSGTLLQQKGYTYWWNVVTRALYIDILTQWQCCVMITRYLILRLSWHINTYIFEEVSNYPWERQIALAMFKVQQRFPFKLDLKYKQQRNIHSMCIMKNNSGHVTICSYRIVVGNWWMQPVHMEKPPESEELLHLILLNCERGSWGRGCKRADIKYLMAFYCGSACINSEAAQICHQCIYSSILQDHDIYRIHRNTLYNKSHSDESKKKYYVYDFPIMYTFLREPYLFHSP